MSALICSCPGSGTSVKRIFGQHDSAEAAGVFSHSLAIYCSADVFAAMANINADPQITGTQRFFSSFSYLFQLDRFLPECCGLCDFASVGFRSLWPYSKPLSKAEILRSSVPAGIEANTDSFMDS